MSINIGDGPVRRDSRAEPTKNPCETPEVDETYLVEHHARVEKFITQQKEKKGLLGDDRLAILKKVAIDMRRDRSKEISFVHVTIFEMVAMHLNLDYKEVLDGVLDNQQHIDLIADLLRAGGKGAVFFIFSSLPIPQDSGRELVGDMEKMSRIVVTDGSTYPLNDNGVLVYRVKKEINIDINNVSSELMYEFLESGKNVNVVEVLEGPLNWSAVEPTRSTTNWGELKVATGSQVRKLFLENLFSFKNFFSTTKDDLRGKLMFEMPEEIVEKVLNHPTSENIMRSSPEAALEMVNIVKLWYKKIEQVLQDANSVRQEVDDRGPRAETEYWRSWLTKFSSIIDFASLDIVQKILITVKSSRSPFVMNWPTLMRQVEGALNEASDNVRYLDDFNAMSQALFITPAPELQEHLRSMLYSIRLIFGCSRYFNTPERVTSLLVKVANQVITSFREYLTDTFSKSIWNIPKKEVISRIQVCLNIYKSFRKYFCETDQAMKENEKEKQFGCSEVNVFVRLASFCARLEKIQEVFQIYLSFSILHSSCLEGVGKLTDDLEKDFKSFIMSTEDPLDDRKPELDEAYNIYKMKILQFEESIRSFCRNLINLCPTVLSALSMLERIGALNISCLCLDIEYLKLLEAFQIELNTIRDRYNEERENVPIPLGLPPFAGRISWSRSFLYKIEEVLNAFKERHHVIIHPRTQLVIRQYNSMCAVLLQYEIEYLSAWCINLANMEMLLEVPVFKRQKLMLKVNWNPYVNEISAEIEAMFKIGVTVPEKIAIFQFSFDDLLSKRDRLSNLTDRYNALKRSIPPMYLTMMTSQLHDLDSLLDVGFEQMSWLSLELSNYCDKVETGITELAYFLAKISDLCSTRIDAAVQQLSGTLLIDLSSPKPLYANQILELNEERHKDLVKEMNTWIVSAENATIEIINNFVEAFAVPSKYEITKRWLDPNKIFDESFLVPEQPLTDQLAFRRWNRPKENDIPGFHRDCMRVYALMGKRLVDALLTSVVASIEALRSRITEDNEIPLFAADLMLFIPNIQLSPSLNEMQAAVMSLAKETLHIFMELTVWGERKEVSGAWISDYNEEKANAPGNVNYFKLISENKEVVRVVQSLQGCILLLKSDITRTIEIYMKHKCLWDEENKAEIISFISKDPAYFEIEDKIMAVINLNNMVMNLPQFHNINCVLVNSAHVKTGLLNEAIAWKNAHGQTLIATYKKKIKTVENFIKERQKILNLHINDLDDVRLAMSCLEIIRNTYIEMNNTIDRIEDTFSLLSNQQFVIPEELASAVDTLRYGYNIMNEKARKVQENLLNLQEPFKEELINRLEQFKEDEAKFHEELDGSGLTAVGLSANEANDKIIILMMKLDTLFERWAAISDGERLFGIPVSDFPVLTEKRKEMEVLNKLYILFSQVIKANKQYQSVLWKKVNVEEMLNELNDFQNRYKKLPKTLMKFSAYAEIVQTVDGLKEMCPLLEVLAHRAIRERHWNRLTELTSYPFLFETPTFCLRDVVQAPLLFHKDGVEDICMGAQKELEVEAKLKAVIAEWQNVRLVFSPFKNRGDLLLKGQDTKDIITQLEDCLMILSSLYTNRYNLPFKKDIQQWLKRLSKSTETLETWLQVQNLWLYLEAVFIAGDIAKQLAQEAKRFSNIDKAWARLMTRAKDIGTVIDVSGDEATFQMLGHLLEQLEACQKSLTGYLETLRGVFPRFYFVSDPTLLEILGQASDCHTIQNHLLNVFENVFLVKFDDAVYDRIVGMYSREMEFVAFEEHVAATGPVEHWLCRLLKTAHSSLNDVIAAAVAYLFGPDIKIIEFLTSSPAQVSLLSLQFIWTRNSEMALKRSRVDRRIMRDTNTSFLALLNLLIEQTTKDLTPVERTKFETLVTIHVHQRDIFDELTRRRIRSPLDFEWLKNMRFYWSEEDQEAIVCVTDVTFIYQNEFMGCTERLVITPLTDRCYITLAQAMGMSMGGAPSGPAGTGKTETTKDMAKALGKYCVVFNCSDQMDFRGLGRIFKGLAQSGSWGCFDEFNRIELPVLSVAAQQISIVLAARKEKKQVFIFSDGDTVPMNMEFGIFITMNPGYAGRQELPENLKMVFRPISMMVPDRLIIMRVKLAACGFKENIELSQKFFTLYRLCEEQLSKQVHYDFGLRNILSVLRTLGAQKRANPNDSEKTTVMSVLRYMNVSKLVDEDEPLFTALVEDLFPGSKVKGSSQRELQRFITEACKELKFVNYTGWNLKIIQLYETSLVRHGLMLLGPTGAGKTTCTRALMLALSIRGIPHHEMRMNPKAITAPQMFGRLDVATNDWTDGIFSTLWRRTLKVPTTECTYLILDGPVDAVWIENLNSVLDDNKTLTLANGDRITMAPNCKLLFEPDNVTNASPATVSRMGMVYLSSSVMPWSTILKGWLITRPDYNESSIQKVCTKIYADLLTCLRTQLHPVMHATDSVYIKQFCDLLDGLLNHVPNANNVSPEHWDRLALFSIMWSVGSLLEIPDRMKLETFVHQHSSKLDWPKTKNEYSIFEYFVDEVGNWQQWTTRVEEYLYPEGSVPDFLSILVPNIDNVRTAYLIRTIAKHEKSVLLIGEQGTAKTVIMKSYLSELNPEFHLNKTFNFSSASTPNMVQRIIESYVEKRIGTQYGPPGGRKLTVFIDDLSMPVVNEWGDQVTNEIVRQLMEMGGFYSIDRPGDFSIMSDMYIVAAMIHPGGGRNDIPDRLKSRFCIFNCTLPSERSIDKIFAAIAEGYFNSYRFNEPIAELASRLVPLTRRVWLVVKSTMLPTPAKFHYVFNLRDLSRIWQGILTVTLEGCDTVNDFLHLWRHECQRVISDRFVTPEEQEWFSSCITTEAIKSLGSMAEILSTENRYFADFLREAPEPTGDEPDDFNFDPPKVYELVPSWEVIKLKLKEYIESYNESVRGTKLDLVFFMDAMKHLLIISRVIRTPRGSIMLVGVGGSGKQCLTRLASHIAFYRTFQIVLDRSYNVTNFLEDLKELYRTAGQDGRGVTFLFTENEIKDETFLEFLNNVLSAGEVANLFTKEEMEEISNNMIPIMKKEHPRRTPTLDALYDYFLMRARSNLHVVLCFSPVGTKFRSRILKFPGLLSGCTINWFQKWPMDALHAVSQHILKDFQVLCTNEVKEELMSVMAEAHQTTSDTCIQYYDRFRRFTSVTPKSFLSLLLAYKNIYTSELAGINTLNTRMSTGVDKLNEAAAGVDVLKKELEVKEKSIAIASAAANEVLQEVTKKAQATEKVKVELQVVKDKAENLVTDIAHETLTAKSKLLAAKPALKAAEDALLTIKASDIATVRKLGKPPYLIKVIMDVVLVLFQRKLSPVIYDEEKSFMQASWSESLKVLADPRFLLRLTAFSKDKINAETIDLMRPYLSFPDYTFEKAKSSSGNVAGLIKWTRAMADFYHINREVLPLKANLAILQKKLSSAQNQLTEAQLFLDEKQKELEEVQAIFNVAHGKQQVVLKDAMACKSKMDTASALINGLTGERKRWMEQLSQFKVQTERLVGDVVLLSTFLCYSGPFNQEFRNKLKISWTDNLRRCKIPVSNNLNITELLANAATVGEWNVFGLPSDELSVQNGILVKNAPRYPLLIDPQNQGKSWIINMEKDSQLQVTGLNDRYFRNYLDDAVSLGTPLLIEDVEEELDPVLDHILEKNYIKIGTSLKVKVGDKELDIHPDFRLYITTKLANPVYTPEIAAKTAVIDFTVTIKGLEEQLLGRVIASEQKDLEIERLNLIKGVTMNRRQMEELETGLLQKLSTVEGSLLDDEDLVKLLNTSKDTSTGLRVQLEVAKKTEEKLNMAREVFRPIATRGSILYFLVTDMALVNNMYQTSLAQFLERFDFSLERAEKHSNSNKRISLINDYLTFEIFRYQTRGLYVVNKFLFALLLAIKVDLEKGAITYEDFLCLVKGGAALDLNTCTPKPCAWISDEAWLNLVQLSNIRPFTHILDTVTNAERQWKIWFYKEAPEAETVPKPYHHLDEFKLFLLIRCFCIDRTFAAGRLYIRHALGPRFAEPIILNMEELVHESRPTTPLLCLLSPGSDPTPQIERLAKLLQTESRAVSMGQGQEVHARKLIERSIVEGGWVLLQNCHLGLAYMSELAFSLVTLENVNPNFRLFLTTEVHPSFPISLLQISIKYTNEVPQGIRAGLQRTYKDTTEDTLEMSDSPKFLPLFFTTSFFHTIVQERRKFGPLGWNIPYEFNQSDWVASIAFIRQHTESINKNANVSWQTIRYMIGEIQYGGRVTDDYDKRLLNTLARHMFGDSIMNNGFEIYPGYPVLTFRTVNEYLVALEGFPDSDSPLACGLHPNANIAYQTNGIRATMLSIMLIQPKQGGTTGGGTREQRVTVLTREMLDKLPPLYKPHETRQRLQAMGSLSPMVIFLRQEIDRMQIVLSIVNRTLRDLLLAIEGSIVMNEALSNTMDSIDEARVPALWLRRSWSSSTIGFWFTELLERNAQFSQWLMKGRPLYFWMTGFFNPQGFLTAMRQEVARANRGWALDTVALSNTVLRQTKESFSKPLAKGVAVYGLFLEGAGWDMRNSVLIEAPPKVLSVPMPLIHIDAINTQDKKEVNNDSYQCPVYKKPQRTDLTFITSLSLGTTKNADHWTMRGVALLCDTK